MEILPKNSDKLNFTVELSLVERENVRGSKRLAGPKLLLLDASRGAKLAALLSDGPSDWCHLMMAHCGCMIHCSSNEQSC